MPGRLSAAGDPSEETEPFLPACGRGFSGIEDDRQELASGQGFLSSFKNLPAAVSMLLVAMAFAICALVGVIALNTPLASNKLSSHHHLTCESLLLVIRHAEKERDATKPGGSGHLSKVGEERADYLSKCMKHTSPALPWGAPSVLMSVTNQSSGSTRPYETLEPLAKELKQDIITIQDDDYDGLMRALDRYVDCDQTVLVAWHHSTMMELVEAVMPSNFWMYHKWPKECQSEGFVEPKWLPGSKCYDIILSMPLRERKGNADRRWWPGWMDIYHQGFGGSKHSKCSEDLSKREESGGGRGEEEGEEGEMKVRVEVEVGTGSAARAERVEAGASNLKAAVDITVE